MEHPARVLATMTALALIAFGAAADAANETAPRQAQIVNGARAAVVALQIKESGDTRPWKLNLLARRPLGIQKQIEIDLPNKPDCFFDVKATLEDGRRIYRPRVNLCRKPKFTVTDF